MLWILCVGLSARNIFVFWAHCYFCNFYYLFTCIGFLYVFPNVLIMKMILVVLYYYYGKHLFLLYWKRSQKYRQGSAGQYYKLWSIFVQDTCAVSRMSQTDACPGRYCGRISLTSETGVILLVTLFHCTRPNSNTCHSRTNNFLLSVHLVCMSALNLLKARKVLNKNVVKKSIACWHFFYWYKLIYIYQLLVIVMSLFSLFNSSS